MGVRYLIDEARRLIEERGELTVARLAYLLNKSYTYTRYTIVRILEDLNECVKFDRERDILLWTCGNQEPKAVAPAPQ